jgi:hypothetical protein
MSVLHGAQWRICPSVYPISILRRSWRLCKAKIAR